MFSERHINLNHPAFRSPTGSLAATSLAHLRKGGYDVVMDPRSESDTVQQYIETEFISGKARTIGQAVLANNAYTSWRNTEKEGHLFLMTNRFGRLAASGWLAPRGVDEEGGTAEHVRAIGRARLHENDAVIGAHFLRVTHAVAIKKIHYASQGILMEKIRSGDLMAACGLIGYQPNATNHNELGIKSGNPSIDMIVSSGPLEDLIRRDAVDILQLPTPERPSLRLIQGEKGD